MLEFKGVFTLSAKMNNENSMEKLKKYVQEKNTENRYKYLIKEYANTYNIDDPEADKEEEQAKIDLQRELLVGLHEKGIDSTLISEYLNYMMLELDHQYSRKSDIESKGGLVLGFLTVLIGVAIGKDNLLKYLYDNFKSNMLTSDMILYNRLFFLGIIICLSIAILSAAVAILYSDYRRYDFAEKKLNFRMILDDKPMSYVKILDTTTNMIQRNDEANKSKNAYLKMSVVFTIVAMVFIVWAYIVIPIN